MKRLLWLLLIAPCFGQVVNPVSSQTALSGGTVTVATLPTGQAKGTLAVVSDGTSATDCTVGGAATTVTCQYSGVVWAAFGGSGTFTGGTVAGATTVTAGGAASTPGLSITGASFVGTGTTSTPQLYINQDATAPTTFSTGVGGTPFGVNAASGFTGNFEDFHVHGAASVYSVSSTGAVTSSATVSAASYLFAGTRAIEADGAATHRTRLGFGLGSLGATGADNTLIGFNALVSGGNAQSIQNTCVGSGSCGNLSQPGSGGAVTVTSTTGNISGVVCSGGTGYVSPAPFIDLINGGGINGQVSCTVTAGALSGGTVVAAGSGYSASFAGLVGNAQDDIGIGFNANKGTSGQHIGYRNDCVGSLCLLAITTGTGNDCIGYSCLTQLTSGIYNTAAGNFAGSAITSGGENVCIGRGTCGMSTTSFNTAVGHGAGHSAVGSNATYLGNSTGGTNTNSGVLITGIDTGGIYVGNSASSNAVAPTNRVAIGNGATSFGDNQFALGGATAYNVAINPTANTTAALTVNGIIAVTSQTVVSSATTIAPTNQFFHVSGTTPIVTITAPASCTTTGTMCQITIIPDGVFTTTTGGNIALASTAVVNRALIMTYDPAVTKWFPSY